MNTTTKTRAGWRTTGRTGAAAVLAVAAAMALAGCSRPGPAKAGAPGEPITAPDTATTAAPDQGTTTTAKPVTTAAPATRPTAGTPATTRPSAPPPIRSVDLGDATYPTAACPEQYRMPGETFTLHDGIAGAFDDDVWRQGQSLGARLQDVVYGDVDGDGVEEAAVHLMCGIAHSDGLSDGVAVMKVAPGGVRPLAWISRSGVPAVGTQAVTRDDGSVAYEPVPLEYELVSGTTLVDGTLTVAWVQTMLGGDALGSGYDVTVTYRIGDGEATMVSQSERTVRPR